MDLDLFYDNVKFCNVRFSVRKVKKVDYSETIAACNLKLIDLIEICEYRRSRSFLDLSTMLMARTKFST